MAHRPRWHRLKVHRSYTVDETARTLGVCKATVRRWIKTHGLPVLDDRRPILLLGRELIAFGKKRRQAKQKCKLDQAYCLACRCPKDAAFGQMEIIEANTKTANVRMQCPTCRSLMHKRFAWRNLHNISPLSRLSASQVLRPLIKTIAPRLIVHFEEVD